MQLATYIKDLLYRYECVIIPGFGAFLTQYQSATIDGANHTMFPPGKQVSFNKQLQTNDGLLANYVATVDGLSYETALKQIRNYASQLSLSLANDKEVVIPQIGSFTLNKEQRVQFIPSQKETFSTASFGLASVTSIPVQRDLYKDQVTALEKNTPLLFTPERREKTPYLRYAAIGLIVLTLAGLSGVKWYEGDVANHNFVQKQKADSLVDLQIQEATFTFPNPLPAINITVPKETGRYHIVAGAFRIEANAFKKIAQLSDKGYTAKYIGANRYGLHQVVYSSFETRQEAQKALSNIQRSENRDAWLLVQGL
jgi:nucleoid DNA-binding protein